MSHAGARASCDCWVVHIARAFASRCSSRSDPLDVLVQYELQVSQVVPETV